MAKVKVYELAKELNIGSKEIINFLSEKNIKVTSHMNNLDESSAELVRNKYVKKETKTITKPESEIKTKEETAAAEPAARPRKKKSITAVFNPQNSQQGLKRQPRPQQRRPKERLHQERLATAQTKPQPISEKSKAVPPKAPAAPVKPEAAPVKPVLTPQKPFEAPEQPKIEKPAADVSVKPVEQPAAKPEAKAEEVKKPAPVQNVYAMERAKAAQKAAQAAAKPAARPQNDRPQGNRNNNRYAGNRENRFQTDRPQGGRNENRPYGGNRPQGERGGRTGDKNNQKNYQNNRPNSGHNQGERGNRGFHSNRPKEFKGKLDREISKFNKESSVNAEELRGKETRERGENRKNNNNRKQDRDKLGKKQERYINLEKHGGRKKPQQQPRQEKTEEAIKSIILPERLTIKELADKMKIQAAVIVKKLFLKGTMVTVNQEVDYDTAEEIALEFNCIAEQEEKIDVIAELLKEDVEEESTRRMRHGPRGPWKDVSFGRHSFHKGDGSGSGRNYAAYWSLRRFHQQSEHHIFGYAGT